MANHMTLPVLPYEKFRRLSPAQQVFLNVLSLYGDSRPPYGQHDSGRHASAWHRTARSLARLGYANVAREGRGYVVCPLVRTTSYSSEM
jgi:hypothetical protein